MRRQPHGQNQPDAAQRYQHCQSDFGLDIHSAQRFKFVIMLIHALIPRTEK